MPIYKGLFVTRVNNIKMVYKATLIILAALLITAKADDDSFNYYSNGRDWDGVCQSGTLQSPIDIDLENTSIGKGAAFPIIFDLDRMRVSGNFLDTTFAVRGSFGYATINTPSGRLVLHAISLLARAPSEHTINGEHFDLEIQIISTDELTGDNVIVSVLFNSGDYENSFLNDLI